MVTTVVMAQETNGGTLQEATKWERMLLPQPTSVKMIISKQALAEDQHRMDESSPIYLPTGITRPPLTPTTNMLRVAGPLQLLRALQVALRNFSMFTRR